MRYILIKITHEIKIYRSQFLVSHSLLYIHIPAVYSLYIPQKSNWYNHLYFVWLFFCLLFSASVPFGNVLPYHNTFRIVNNECKFGRSFFIFERNGMIQKVCLSSLFGCRETLKSSIRDPFTWLSLWSQSTIKLLNCFSLKTKVSLLSYRRC